MNGEIECGCIILGGWFLRDKDCKIHGLSEDKSKRGFGEDGDKDKKKIKMCTATKIDVTKK